MKVFRMSPELSDEEHYTLAFSEEQVMEAIQAWFDADPEYGVIPGQKFSIECLEMTDEEIDRCPEI